MSVGVRVHAVQCLAILTAPSSSSSSSLWFDGSEDGAVAGELDGPVRAGGPSGPGGPGGSGGPGKGRMRHSVSPRNHATRLRAGDAPSTLQPLPRSNNVVVAL